MTENEISFLLRGCIFKVYNNLGPGLLESAYQSALAFEIQAVGLNVRIQVPLPMIYQGEKTDVGYRIDLLVENKVVVEIKSVESLQEVRHQQVITYLKLAKLKLGLLVNFNTVDIAKNIIRKVNGL